MRILRSFSNALSVVERSLVVTLLSVMVLLAFLQVILRNYFSTGFLWADPFLRHMVLWVGFLGASLATQNEKHISMDILTRYASPKVANIVRILTNLFAATVCTVLANAGWTFLKSEMQSGGYLLTIGSTEFPAWWFQVVIPACFCLLAIRFTLRVAEHLYAALRARAQGAGA